MQSERTDASTPTCGANAPTRSMQSALLHIEPTTGADIRWVVAVADGREARAVLAYVCPSLTTLVAVAVGWWRNA